MSINRVVISGNLTRDPELRTTASGMPIMSMGVAVNDRRKNNQTGEWEDYANFIDCTMFGTRAQNIQRFLSKGQKRSKIEVIVDDIDFGGNRNGGNNGGDASLGNDISAYSAPATSTMPAIDTTASVYDEDIPF